MRKNKLFPICLTTSLAVFLGLAWLASTGRAGAALNSSLPVYEMALKPGGKAFEINLDGLGRLWVSDYDAGEVWELDPVSRVYTRYAGLGYPGDARPDGNGSVWYADAAGGNLGQLSLDTGTLTKWVAAGSDGLYATQVDGAGNVWATSWSHPLLFRFDPVSQEICAYEIPSTSASKYLEADGQLIWLADDAGKSIFRLDPALDEYTLWELPSAGWPFGLDLDQAKNLWWADSNLGAINRLEADLDLLTTFDLPITSNPAMLDASTSEIRFSDDLTGTIGSLSIASATGITTTLTSSLQPVAPTCNPIEPLSTTPVTLTTGVMAFTPASYASLVDSAGWKIWQVPDNGVPYGVRVSGKSTWVVDYFRQKLIWQFSGAVVSACKLADEDGDIDTTGDQTPVKDWRVYLKVDGVRQEPGELTSAAGCYTWLDLDSGHTYAVEEELPDGWTALTPTENNFGPAAEGQLYSYTFVNHQVTRYIYLPVVIR